MKHGLNAFPDDISPKDFYEKHEKYRDACSIQKVEHPEEIRRRFAGGGLF